MEYPAGTVPDRVVGASVQILDDRQRPAASTRPVGQGCEIAGPVPDQRHREIVQLGDNQFPDATRLARQVAVEDLDDHVFGAQMQAALLAFVRDRAEFGFGESNEIGVRGRYSSKSMSATRGLMVCHSSATASNSNGAGKKSLE